MKQKIFIILSCVFLVFMVGFYGFRLFYFKNLNKQTSKIGETTFASVINSKAYDPILLKEDKNLYYQGYVLNNYVFYNNRYYRILGMEDNKIVLVDNITTILPFNKEYTESDIYKWLNNNYLKSISNYQDYLVNTRTCLDNDCKTYNDSLVGLISRQNYDKALKEDNFLNNDNYFWLADGTYVGKDNHLHKHDDGLYGVRAVITLKEDTLYYGGTGTYYDPYFITLGDALTFDNTSRDIVKIGSYIRYSDRLWKVVDNKDNLKVVLDDTIGKRSYGINNVDITNKLSLAYYLNYTFYQELDKTYLKEGQFNVGTYESSLDDINSTKLHSYVGLMSLGDLLMNDYNDYILFTNTGSKNTVFKVMDGMLYEDDYRTENNIKPVIFLDKNIPIKDGYGTKNMPFEVGEE